MAFFDLVTPTAQALLPLLDASNEVAYICDEVRGYVLQTWGLLIKCARVGASERGAGPDLARDLFRTGLQKTFAALEIANKPDVLSKIASGIAECIKNVGPGAMGQQEVPELVTRIFVLIDQSIARSSADEHAKNQQKTENAQVGLANDEEDEEKDDDEELEKELRSRYVDVLGALMVQAPEFFASSLSSCGAKMQGYIATKRHRVLALYIGCQLVEHLKAQSEPAWPFFMEEVLRVLGEKEEHDSRMAAAYCINLAAGLPSFDKAAPEAFRKLCALASAPKPKKRDEMAALVRENAIAALLSLAIEKSQLCPPEIGASAAWAMIVAGLPLTLDEDEAKKVHEKVAGLVLAQNAGLIGGDQRSHLGKVLSILAEVHGSDDFSAKDTDTKITTVFKSLPVEVFQACASSFTEKQQKKIESIIKG